MSARTNDAALIARLVWLCQSVTAAPHKAADFLDDLVEIEDNLNAAQSSLSSRIGWAEAICLECLLALASRPLLSGASALRLTRGATIFLDEVLENYQAAERAALGEK